MVVLYEHSLLGEGIARLVLAETGVEVTVVRAGDLDAVRAALGSDPCVVVYELSRPLHDLDLAEFAPHAVFIDVTAAMSHGPVPPSVALGIEPILAAVRGSSTAG